MARKKKSSRPKRLVNYGEYWLFPAFTLKMMTTKAAVLFAFLVNFQTKCEWNNGKVKHLPWFYCTIPTMEEQTGLGRYSQGPAIDELGRLRLLKMETRGRPPKRFFFIDWDAVDKLHEKYCERNDDEWQDDV